MSRPEATVPPGSDPPLDPEIARARLAMVGSQSILSPNAARVHGLASIVYGAALGAFIASLHWIDGLTGEAVALGVCFLVVTPLWMWESRTRGTPRHALRTLRTGRLVSIPIICLLPLVLQSAGISESGLMAATVPLLAAAPWVVAGVLVMRQGRS